MDRSLTILDNAISETIHATRTFPGWQQHTVEALIEHAEWKGNFCHSSYDLSVAYNKLTNQTVAQEVPRQFVISSDTLL